MTILQAITQSDARRHNGYSLEEKLRWLSQLDGKVKRLILDTHEGAEVPFEPYDLSTPMDTPLLIKAPFEEVYVYWLEAQSCYADGELDDYNTAIAQYNRLYGSYADDHQRRHMPKPMGRRFLF